MTIRVTFVSYDDTPPQGGQGVELEGMRQALNDHDVAVTTISGRGDHAVSYPRRSGRAPLDFSLYVNRHLGIVGDTGPDVVHALGGPGGVLITRKLGSPLVYTANHTYRQAHRRGRPQRAMTVLERRAYRQATRVLAISESTADAVRALGIPPALIEVLPPGVDVDAEIDDTTRVPGRVLFLGRLEHEKGVLQAIEVMDALGRRSTPTQCVIAGAGSLEAEVRRRVARTDGRVVFLGRISEEQRIHELRRAAIVLQPSLYEGLGLVALEAMGRGAVVVGCAVAGLVDTVPVSGGGVLLPVATPAAMVAETAALIVSPDRRAEMARAGHAWVAEHHSWVMVGRRLAEVYHEVTRGLPPRV